MSRRGIYEAEKSHTGRMLRRFGYLYIDTD